jgi:hypothetical protein
MIFRLLTVAAVIAGVIGAVLGLIAASVKIPNSIDAFMPAIENKALWATWIGLAYARPGRRQHGARPEHCDAAASDLRPGRQRHAGRHHRDALIQPADKKKDQVTETRRVLEEMIRLTKRLMIRWPAPRR